MAENPILNNRYRLIEQIGSGGMAVIYKAQDMELGRLVTVKVLRPSLVSDPEFLMRFKREAQAAANLSHPNIVIVYDVGQDGPKTHYIVMEYVPGQDLKKLIRARSSFEVDEALAIIIEVCKGVGYAHRAGLVHCDVKPQNILVTPDNRIKVTDFGIARALTGAAPQVEDMVWGSPHYFSPEQAAGETPTPASDVYSVGVVLFELLTGRLPFTGSDYQALAMAHLKEQPPSILDLNPALPPELDKIIRKVMSKEPSARYRTADQLGRILEKYLEEGQQQTTAFVVNPSAVDMDAEPTYQRNRVQAQYAEPTLESLPPVEIAENRPYARAAYQTYDQYDTPVSDSYTIPDRSFLPGVDLYGIALGILAAIALLGLIPLWFAVYRVLTRQ
jgi:eukaryotic-like serine/threonine-protein kinase